MKRTNPAPSAHHAASIAVTLETTCQSAPQNPFSCAEKQTPANRPQMPPSTIACAEGIHRGAPPRNEPAHDPETDCGLPARAALSSDQLWPVGPRADKFRDRPPWRPLPPRNFAQAAQIAPQ